MAYAEMSNFMSILEDYARNSAYILEIGIGDGTGSMTAFTRGLESRGGNDRLYVSVDITDKDCPVENRPKVTYWRFVVGDSQNPETLLRTWAIAGERRPDLIFLDTVHTYEFIQPELEIWGKYFHPGTIWLFHDTYMFGIYNHMTEAIKEYAAANGWVYDDVSTEMHGLGRMRRRPA